MSGKYWENEKPKEFKLGINVFKHYEEAGKLQVFRHREGTRFGVTKGCTIDLGEMSDDELIELAEIISEVMKSEIDKRGTTTGKKAKVKKDNGDTKSAKYSDKKQKENKKKIRRPA
jgi:hypothetical protein